MLLSQIGLKFEIVVSDTDEYIDKDNFDLNQVEQVAMEKVEDVATKVQDDVLIIGADTVVVVGKKVLGKPKDENESFEMLRFLSGKTHYVYTSIAILDKQTGEKLIKSTKSEVTFRKLKDQEILNYIQRETPFDKAGSYGIQGVANLFVEKINGCYNNIVGLSLYTLGQMLEEFDIKLVWIVFNVAF